MEKQNANNQSGFAMTLTIIVAVALMGTVGTVGYLKINEAKYNKSIAETQKLNDQKVAEAKALQEKKKTEEITKVNTSEPTPAPAVATESPTAPSSPAPSSPAANVSNATAFTATNCTGWTTVYVSNPNGADASYRPPSNWEVVKTYPYGQALSVYCVIGDSDLAPDYVLIADAYVKSTNLSPTQP